MRIEALYAQDRNPISTLMAVEGLWAFKTSLPAIIASPGDIDGRADALYGAWLCGTVLGTVGMALHHKICHTLAAPSTRRMRETQAAIMLPRTAASLERRRVPGPAGLGDGYFRRLGRRRTFGILPRPSARRWR